MTLSCASAQRIKDIADIQGVRSNQLIGYGLVVGLDGTGDSAVIVREAFKELLHSFGVALPANNFPNTKNIAAVMVQAELPPFARTGQRIDVTVSSIGDSVSLKGGTLLTTALKGVNGEIYALAQGSLVVGAYGMGGDDGSKTLVNAPLVGRIANAAIVEKTIPNPLQGASKIVYFLKQHDFTTAHRMSQTINDAMGSEASRALDGSSVEVQVPVDDSDRVLLISQIENLTLATADIAAKVIVNARTGTIIIGQNVVVKPTAITHGRLTLQVKEVITSPDPKVGTTTQDKKNKSFVFEPGVTLSSIVDSLNLIGAAPADITAILECLKQSGALQAELVII